MQVTPYYLSPGATLHIGRQGIEQEQTLCAAPADTLFSALLVAAMEGGCPPEVWGDAFGSAERAPFWLGSSFPYAGGVRFYPRPQVDLTAFGAPADQVKDLGRITHVSRGIWEQFVQGRPLGRHFPSDQNGGEGVSVQNGTLWLTRDEVSQLPVWMRQLGGPAVGRARPLRALKHLDVWKEDQMPRVTVDRLRQSSEIYYTGRVAYAPECGLWFPVAWRDAASPACEGLSWRSLFERALGLLADAGLGGDRSAGLGGFTWRAGATETWPQARPGAPMVTLSRYHPGLDELPAALQGDHIRYRLVSVAGYLSSPGRTALRRRRLWLIGEGSVLTATNPAGMGDLTDVRPVNSGIPHPVWRYGLAFPVPLEVRHA